MEEAEEISLSSSETLLDDVTDKDADSDVTGKDTSEKTEKQFGISTFKFLNDLAAITGYPYDQNFKINPEYGRSVPREQPAAVASSSAYSGLKKKVKAQLALPFDEDMQLDRKQTLLNRKMSALMDLIELEKLGSPPLVGHQDPTYPHRKQILAELHKFGGPVKNNGRTLYACYHCDKRMMSENLLYAHFKLVHLRIKDFSCEECGRSFFSSGQLELHTETKHKIEKDKYSCPLCPLKFHSREILRTHKYRKHSQTSKKPVIQKPVACDECGMVLAGADTLRRHRLTHSTDRRFKCRHCDKGFKSGRNRSVHERTHTGIKPYKCTQCEESFAHNIVRKSHEFRVHGNEEFRYICERDRDRKRYK